MSGPDVDYELVLTIQHGSDQDDVSYLHGWDTAEEAMEELTREVRQIVGPDGWLVWHAPGWGVLDSVRVNEVSRHPEDGLLTYSVRTIAEWAQGQWVDLRESAEAF